VGMKSRIYSESAEPNTSVSTIINWPPLHAQSELDKVAGSSDCDQTYSAPVLLKVSSLIRADSPRSGGEDKAHIKRLLEAEWPLPPILVHRDTNHVLDGFHRVSVAKIKKIDEILACYVGGSLDSAFIAGIRANVTHGLPLSLADRRTAARRILLTHSDWSDRAIASATGLSAKTISALRCSSAENQQLDTRLGKDGRLRPINSAAGRQLAAKFLALEPGAALRDIAEAVGISPATVSDVKARLRRGEDPVPVTLRRKDDICQVPVPKQPRTKTDSFVVDVVPVLQTLAKDPALCMRGEGRDLLRWLHLHAVNRADGSKIPLSLPNHCIHHIIELARRCSANWEKIASDLEQRYEST
jgi:uncharacterized protein YerC